MNDINQFIFRIQFSPLLCGQRIELDFVRPFEDEYHLQQAPALSRPPDKQLVVAFLIRPRSPNVSNDVFGLTPGHSVPGDMGKIPLVPDKEQIHLNII